jgi:VanZ family protein
VKRPIFVSLVLVAAAPFIGEARRWLQRSLPDGYVWVLGGAVAAAALAVVLLAVRRITTDRPARYARLVLALTIAAVYTWQTGSRVPAVAVVEQFHFIQYGVITALFYQALRTRADVFSVVGPVAAALVFGTLEEWWQWWLPARVGELRDVMLNLVAIVCGLLAVSAITPLPSPFRRQGLRPAGIAAAAALGVALAFTWVVHAGYRITMDDGTFVSRYNREGLVAEADLRRRLWASDPPLVRRTLAREDQYRSEGEAHVRARNAAWDAGDVRTAWFENRILEEFYAPVLDTPSHISPTGHRWDAAHRADAARRLNNLSATAALVESAAAVDTWWIIG